MPKKNAYLILAHSDPAHLRKLVESANATCDIYVHIDAKSDIGRFDDVLRLPNVHATPRRHWVIWAGISMVDAILELMAAAIGSGNDYGHLAILTGADYPIKSEHFINSVFADHADREFVKYSNIYDNADYTRLISRKYFREPFVKSRSKYVDRLDRAARKACSSIGLRNDWNKDVVPYRGHTWCALTQECCRYILNYVAENPWYHRMNVHSFAPDEHYFHTIIGNSPFAEKTFGIQPCRGSLALVGVTHLIDDSLTHWFTLDDWERVSRSERLFVRKVRSQDGSGLVERIDAELRA